MLSNSSDSDDSNGEEIIRNFEEEGKLILNQLLPLKSCAKYETTYSIFMKWKEEQNANSFDENVLLVYFNELSKKFKPSILWSQWSMLRTTLNLKHGVNINVYEKLKTLLKNKSKGFKATKSKVLTWTQIHQFITHSEGTIHLGAEVIVTFGICGALRCQEFCNINTSDVEDTGSQFIVTVKDIKKYYPRNFIIGAELYDIVKKYIELRPTNMDTNRFFIRYQNGVCMRQVIGKNKISEVPKNIALFLNLEAPEKYTGHCMRRTAATLLANSGASLTTVKQLGGWRSSTSAEGYIEHSLANRRKIFEKFWIINSDKSCAKVTTTTSTTTSPAVTSTVTAASVSVENLACSSSKLILDDSENYPPFSIDEIDESTMMIKTNGKQLIPSASSASTGSSRLEPIGGLKRHALQDNFKSTKKRSGVMGESQSPSSHIIQNTVLDEVSLKSTSNQFHNCVIHNITNNYYISSDFKK